MNSKNKRLLIVLGSLCAEGTPVLVLEMCRWWLSIGIQPYIVTIRSTPNDLLAEFQELGLFVISLNIPKAKAKYQRYFRLISDTYLICQQQQPHALLSMVLGWHAFIAYGARLAGVPSVAAHVGNYPPYWIGFAFHKFRLQVQLGRLVTNRLICCSRYIQDGVIKYFWINKSETMTIYNGCPVESIARRANIVSGTDTPFTIGMVARLEKHKDQPTLIAAARILKKRGIKFQIQLIGEGSRRNEYKELINRYRVNDCVRLLGMRRDVPELLGKMHLFVFSAKPDEGLGVALVEAMSAGIPIVATQVGACCEVLDNGELGLLVPPCNPQLLADGICQVINSPEAAQLRAKKARDKALKHFSISAMAREYAFCLDLLS